MTTRVQLTNLSNTTLKISLVSPGDVDGKANIHSERLLMNTEPQEFTVSEGRSLVIAEAPNADDGDNAKPAALEAAAKEPQRLDEQRNPQVQLDAGPHDPQAQPVTHPTPMANTRTETVYPAPTNNAQKAP